MQVEKKHPMSDAQIEEAAALFTVLSEPSRLHLLRELMSGPLTVGALADATGLKQGNVSKHLALLLQARFVSRTQEGNFVRYEIVDRRLFEICSIMCERIGEDAKRRGRLLADMK